MFSITVTKLIQEFCKPHHKIGLTNFMHDITFGKGQISMLVSNKDLFLFYYNNKIPMLCTDESGRTLASGIYINKILEEQYNECSILMPLMVRVGQQYGQNFGKNSLHIVVRENECQHLYSLFFDLFEKEFLHWVINNGSLLQDLLASYNYTAKDAILEVKSPENRIILPNYNPIKISDTSNNSTHTSFNIIHKKLNMPVYLSSQQGKCLVYLMQGKSAKEIALAMNLSHRTVEHYLEKIRKILDCTSNKELIVSYCDQFISDI